MDFCPVCGVAVDVRQGDGKTVFVCRNPQCGQYGKTLAEEKRKGETENG